MKMLFNDTLLYSTQNFVIDLYNYSFQMEHSVNVPDGLALVYNEEVLQETLRLKDYGILYGSTIHLVREHDTGYHVYVEILSGKKILIVVHHRDTIVDVKAKIQVQ